LGWVVRHAIKVVHASSHKRFEFCVKV
jgi:hypothetical protein